jgi:hypothetical protein
MKQMLLCPGILFIAPMFAANDPTPMSHKITLRATPDTAIITDNTLDQLPRLTPDILTPNLREVPLSKTPPQHPTSTNKQHQKSTTNGTSHSTQTTNPKFHHIDANAQELQTSTEETNQAEEEPQAAIGFNTHAKNHCNAKNTNATLPKNMTPTKRTRKTAHPSTTTKFGRHRKPMKANANCLEDHTPNLKKMHATTT